MYRINGKYLVEIARMHYEGRYNPPRKAYDFYCATALVYYMQSKKLLGLPRRQLFYSDEYGLALVSDNVKWEATLASYQSRIDTRLDPGDSDFIKTKKEYFQREMSIMQTIPQLPRLEVRTVYHTFAV